MAMGTHGRERQAMTATERDELTALSIGWRRRSCLNPDGTLFDCGDHDCETLRGLSVELLQYVFSVIERGDAR